MYESELLPRTGNAPVIGLALGSGAARGWSHLGVIAALEQQGIHPQIITGCSIGALVGAAYASGKLAALQKWVTALDWPSIVSMIDISFKGGLLRGDRIVQYCAEHFFAQDFEQLKKPFACVATDLHSGREIWLRRGSIARAVRASIALPGLFSPVNRHGRMLVDGGLVNPVPVSLCRALGADLVIAVELGSGIVTGQRPADNFEAEDSWGQRFLNALGLSRDHDDKDTAAVADMPSMTAVISSSINIMQMRIARSRLAGEPADLVVSPRVSHISVLEFERASEAIEEGVAAVERIPDLSTNLGL